MISEAANGAEAVEKFKAFRPDVVTMDVTMPEMTGVEALGEILKVDPQAKIIMCTALGNRNIVLEAITSGAKDFIIKPFQGPRVLDSINRLCGT